MLFHFLTGEKVRIYRIFNESVLYVIGYIFLKFLLLPILLQNIITVIPRDTKVQNYKQLGEYFILNFHALMI